MRFDWSTSRAATHTELAIRSYLYLENCEIYLFLSEVGFLFNAGQLIDKLDWEIGY